MAKQDNPWDKFYEEGGEYTMMQYPFGVVIEFINRYCSKKEIKGKDLKTIKVIEFEGLPVNDSNFKVCSFDQVEFPDNYFDMVIDRGALLYADNDTFIRTINNIYKMLKKGGMFLLTPRSEVDTPTIKLIHDEYGFDARSNLFKDKYHIENTFSLKDIVKILDNRFEFLVLRRNDRVKEMIE